MHRTQCDVLIIGGGHAGAHVAITLRQKGFKGTLTIISEDPELPYERPPLSKGYLDGTFASNRLYLRKPEFWSDRQIEIYVDCKAIKINRSENTVTLNTLQDIEYNYCILATGGNVRTLTCRGVHLKGVYYLRTKADVDAIRASLFSYMKIIVVGGGFVGLEAAASLRKLGHEVTLIENQGRVLTRVTSPIVSQFYETQHELNGVRLHLSTNVMEIRGDKKVEHVLLSSGELLPADLVIAGIGISPNDDLAQNCGLACNDGILVNEYCQTMDPRIYAIGDCARHPNVFARDLYRLESVQNAVDQAKTAALAILSTPEPYQELPWFWSDQYELKLQTAGLVRDYDEIIIRGDSTKAPFSVLYMRQGHLVAIDAINSIKDFMSAKNLIQSGALLNKDLLSNPNIALKDVLAQSSEPIS